MLALRSYDRNVVSVGGLCVVFALFIRGDRRVNVKARRISGDSFFDYPDPAPGRFAYYVNQRDERTGMLFMCPCGCGEPGSLNFETGEKPCWHWDGNEDAPTLTPSVLRTRGCKWHGWLRAGEWVSV